MWTIAKLVLPICLLACAIFVASSPTTFPWKFVYVDETGIHYEKEVPSAKAKRHSRNPRANDINHGEQGISDGHGWGDDWWRHPQNHGEPVIEALLKHEAQSFCSEWLHIVPYAATTTTTSTRTTSGTLATVTTTTTSTTDLGTTTVSTTTTSTGTTTSTAATVTGTTTKTDTTTQTTTTMVSTTYLHTAPAHNPVRRGERGLGHLPYWLPFADQKISSACSHIVTPKTKVVPKTATATATLTATLTATTTRSVGPKTVTDTSSTTTIIVVPATETATTTATMTITASATVNAIATACASSQPMDGGGVGADGGSLNFFSDPDAESCCTRCWGSSGCGLWFYFAGYGCFNANNANGPNPNAQCPTGFGHYVTISGTPGDGNVGGEGPCGGGLN